MLRDNNTQSSNKNVLGAKSLNLTRKILIPKTLLKIVVWPTRIPNMILLKIFTFKETLTSK